MQAGETSFIWKREGERGKEIKYLTWLIHSNDSASLLTTRFLVSRSSLAGSGLRGGAVGSLVRLSHRRVRAKIQREAEGGSRSPALRRAPLRPRGDPPLWQGARLPSLGGPEVRVGRRVRLHGVQAHRLQALCHERLLGLLRARRGAGGVHGRELDRSRYSRIHQGAGHFFWGDAPGRLRVVQWAHHVR